LLLFSYDWNEASLVDATDELDEAGMEYLPWALGTEYLSCTLVELLTEECAPVTIVEALDPPVIPLKLLAVEISPWYP